MKVANVLNVVLTWANPDKGTHLIVKDSWELVVRRAHKDTYTWFLYCDNKELDSSLGHINGFATIKEAKTHCALSYLYHRYVKKI